MTFREEKKKHELTVIHFSLIFSPSGNLNSRKV